LHGNRPVFKFAIETEQQETLERVARSLAHRAIFTYAAPVFHSAGSLFRHGTHGTIVENSTFPDVLSLKGHEAWYYNEPGALGIANPTPERIVGKALGQRLDDLSKSGQRLNAFLYQPWSSEP